MEVRQLLVVVLVEDDDVIYWGGTSDLMVNCGFFVLAFGLWMARHGFRRGKRTRQRQYEATGLLGSRGLPPLESRTVGSWVAVASRKSSRHLVLVRA